ncbi:MAG: sucrose synthase [Fibrobacterota bacterium]
MDKKLLEIISKKEAPLFKEFVFVLTNQEKKHLLRNDIILLFEEFCGNKKKRKKFVAESDMALFFNAVPELFVGDGFLIVQHRFSIARYKFLKISSGGDFVEEISIEEYLDYKDNFVLDGNFNNSSAVEIDFLPFYDYSPSIKSTKHIGNGMRFLNNHLSSSIFNNPVKWNQRLFEFLKIHKIEENALLINGAIIKDFDTFYHELEKMAEKLEKRKDQEAPYASIEPMLKKRGFEPGWGNTVGRVLETMQLLLELINVPESSLLEKFISRVPMVSKIAVLSPHGWFGQQNVLGKPDTGGQVIYILDQVKALEKYLSERFELAGIKVKPKIVIVTRLIPNAGDTTCGQRMEKVFQTENCWILRVPFRDESGNVLEDWITRFRIWPFLHRFADDVHMELLSEFGGRPDLIIGNYSDGNLVASLLSEKMDVILCTIAHALEKTKYLFSDMYWQEMEEDYRFSLQFTADILAMNKSNFIITSTYQEIAGTPSSMGQYESYQFFSLPGLYQVKGGVNLYHPKFNVIPPGVDEENYFPFKEYERRLDEKKQHLCSRLFDGDHDDIYGNLEDIEKPVVFTMARFDKIKNITGLIEAFGMSPSLRQDYNLIFAAGTTKIEESKDIEEQKEIQKAYNLIEKYNLHGTIRWLPSISKIDTGEVYRIIADKKGVFVQPALFEAFGLTVLEAMLCGLPTFGPIFGGPSEIIKDGKSGFLMNTSEPNLIGAVLEKFHKDSIKDTKLWEKISENGIKRVRECFTWKLYSSKLLTLTKLYGFWRYSVSNEGKKKMNRYCDLIYHLLLRKRAEK